MPLFRILAAGAFALVLMLGALWAMDVNYAAWVGAWLSPKNQYSAGFAVIVIVGLGMAWLYARFIGTNFPAPGMVRGVVFALVLAATAIWVVPYTLEFVASAVGNTQVVYGGRGIHDDTPTTDQQMQDAMTRVEPCKPIFGVQPPFAKLTRNTQWAPADAWKGRLLPFGIAFFLYGLVIGALLSEKFDNKRPA
jgi:hypothetical protein